MIYTDEPENFAQKFEVVGCFLEYEGKFLALHRQNHKPEGDKWCLPSGKIDAEESRIEAMLREIREETQLKLKEKDLQYNRTLYVRYPTHDFTHHIFQSKISNPRIIRINQKEHKGYAWISPKNALKLPLVLDFDDCIKLVYNLE